MSRRSRPLVFSRRQGSDVLLNPLGHVVLLAFIPVTATALGAFIAAWRNPSAVIRSGLQHFAAGVVFSVVAVELLPDVVRSHSVLTVTLGFAAGIAVMVIVRRVNEDGEAEPACVEHESEGHAPVPLTKVAAAAAEPGAPKGMLVAVGIDVLLDGLLLGIAFAAGAKEGVMLTIALSLELVSLGLAMTATLISKSSTRARAVAMPTSLVLLLPVGAALGDTVLHNASRHLLGGVLSFGCAALLFLVTEELLVEAHETPETIGATAMFFAGFLLFLILGMVA